MGITHGGLPVPVSRRYHRFASVMMLVLCLFGLWQSPRAGAMELPFQPGEKLYYQLKWLWIPAGVATLEVLPVDTVNGQAAHHFALTVRSNTFFDRLYKVRDRIDSYADLSMTRALFYRKKQHEGRYRNDSEIRFDWAAGQARYVKRGKMRVPIPILPGTFDPLSVFYFARLMDIRENATLSKPVTDGKRCVLGKATVIRKEKVTIASGTFDTYLLVPELKHIRGVFRKSKNASIHLWVTADRRRIPVKIKSRVVVGSFEGELVKAVSHLPPLADISTGVR